MPAAVTMPLELDQHDFAVLARKELDGRVRLRLLALAHLREGKRLRQVGAGRC